MVVFFLDSVCGTWNHGAWCVSHDTPHVSLINESHYGETKGYTNDNPFVFHHDYCFFVLGDQVK